VFELNRQRGAALVTSTIPTERILKGGSHARDASSGATSLGSAFRVSVVTAVIIFQVGAVSLREEMIGQPLYSRKHG
jgi:hypothetical protein